MLWFTHDKWWFSCSLSVSLQYLVIFNTFGFHSPTLDIRCLPHTMVTERCSSLFDGSTLGYTLVSEPPNNSFWVPYSSLLSSRLAVGRMAGMSLCWMGFINQDNWGAPPCSNGCSSHIQYGLRILTDHRLMRWIIDAYPSIPLWLYIVIHIYAMYIYIYNYIYIFIYIYVHTLGFVIK